MRRHVYSRQTRKRKTHRNVRGGKNFFGNVSNFIGKTARQIKSAVEVTAVALIDTSNVKRLHFKNQFFIDYLDIDTIRKLYGDLDSKIIIKYDKHINDTTTTSDRLGQNGYLAYIDKNHVVENNYLMVEPTTVKEDNKFNDFFNYSIFSKDAISFNRLNNAEIIDPRFYSDIKKSNPATTDLVFFQKHCIAFKNDDLHNAMFEMMYYWKYLLHSMLWDANDKTRYILYFLYSEFTKKILQNGEHVKKLRNSSFFIRMLNYLHDLFRNIATRKTKEELELSNEIEEIVNSGTNEPPDEYVDGGSSEPTQKTIKKLSVNDIITQVRGFFNVPYSIVKQENINSFIDYAKKNKKYTELPPYYTVIDVKYALYTVNKFLQQIIDTSKKDPKELMDIIYFKNSQLSTVYNKVVGADKKKYPIIVKFEEYTSKNTFFKDLFGGEDYRKSTELNNLSCNYFIHDILGKQEKINQIIKDFVAKKENYESLENSKLLKVSGMSQYLVNILSFGLIGEPVTVKGGGLNEINQRFGYYLEKKKSIIQEKYNKIISTFNSHPFLDLIKCALFQSALNTYRKYIIEPMFPEYPTEHVDTTLPLKLYKTLGLYSLRMVNMVCQSPINQILKRSLDIAWYYKFFLKSPHCYKLGFLTSMIREQWSFISPPIETPANDTTSTDDTVPASEPESEPASVPAKKTEEEIAKNNANEKYLEQPPPYMRYH